MPSIIAVPFGTRFRRIMSAAWELEQSDPPHPSAVPVLRLDDGSGNGACIGLLRSFEFTNVEGNPDADVVLQLIDHEGNEAFWLSTGYGEGDLVRLSLSCLGEEWELLGWVAVIQELDLSPATPKER